MGQTALHDRFRGAPGFLFGDKLAQFLRRGEYFSSRLFRGLIQPGCSFNRVFAAKERNAASRNQRN
jgi:hypothetical protein